jgi:hypothetical protein
VGFQVPAGHGLFEDLWLLHHGRRDGRAGQTLGLPPGPSPAPPRQIGQSKTTSLHQRPAGRPRRVKTVAAKHRQRTEASKTSKCETEPERGCCFSLRTGRLPSANNDRTSKHSEQPQDEMLAEAQQDRSEQGKAEPHVTRATPTNDPGQQASHPGLSSLPQPGHRQGCPNAPLARTAILHAGRCRLQMMNGRQLAQPG